MIALINKQYVFEYGNSNDLAKSLSVYKKNNQLLVIVDRSDRVKGLLIDNYWTIDAFEYLENEQDYRLYGCPFTDREKLLKYNGYLPTGLDWEIYGIPFKVFDEAWVPIDITK